MNPSTEEWQPVEIGVNVPGKMPGVLHHRHGDEVPCVACSIVNLRAELTLLWAVAEATRPFLNLKDKGSYVLGVVHQSDVERLSIALATLDVERRENEDLGEGSPYSGNPW